MKRSRTITARWSFDGEVTEAYILGTGLWAAFERHGTPYYKSSGKSVNNSTPISVPADRKFDSRWASVGALGVGGYLSGVNTMLKWGVLYGLGPLRCLRHARGT